MDAYIQGLEDGFNLPRDDADDDDDDDNGGEGLRGGNKPYVALAVLLIIRFV